MTTPEHETSTEARIAALEERLRVHEARLEQETAAKEIDWLLFFERWGLLIAWIALILVLGALKPSLMSFNPYAVMAGTQAMVIILTLALIVPLTAGDFDLSVASTLGLSSMLAALLMVKAGMPIIPAVVLCLMIGAAIGAVNAFFILYFNIHSLIVTLGVGYFINGVILWVSNSQTVAGVPMGLINGVILTKLFGVPLAFWYALLLVIVLWCVFDYTSLGRRLLFTGRGAEVARLSGVNTTRMRAGALIVSGVIAAMAGVIYTGMRGAADPTSGLSFLLPAFAAAFLGSTAISPGRFNAWGSMLAVLFLSTGILGLNFLGADSFVQNLFYGGGLVIAVSLSQLIRKRQPMN